MRGAPDCRSALSHASVTYEVDTRLSSSIRRVRLTPSKRSQPATPAFLNFSAALAVSTRSVTSDDFAAISMARRQAPIRLVRLCPLANDKQPSASAGLERKASLAGDPGLLADHL